MRRWCSVVDDVENADMTALIATIESVGFWNNGLPSWPHALA